MRLYHGLPKESTTLSVAEDTGRVPYGIKYKRERADWTREQISHSEHVQNGDILDLESSWFLPVDCCFTKFAARQTPSRSETGIATLANTERRFVLGN